MSESSLNSLAVRTRLIEQMFSALPSIVLIVLGHALAGTTAWLITGDGPLLLLTICGTGVGVCRIAHCCAFAGRPAGSDTEQSLARWTIVYGVGGTSYSLALAAMTGRSLSLGQIEAALLCLTVSLCYVVGMIVRVAVVPAVARVQLVSLILPLCGVTAYQMETAFVVLAVLLAMFCFGGLQLIQHMHDMIVSRLDAERELARLAFKDHLTALPNRSCFETAGEQQRAAALRTGGPAVLAALDLDGFKQVNDRFGHSAGDHVLKITASRLQHVLGHDHLVARLGGDEFVIHFLAGTEPDEAERLVRQVLVSMAAPIAFEGRALRISVSIGLAYSHLPTTSLSTLMLWADQELYRSKAAGKNQISVRTDDAFPIAPFAA